MAQTGRSLVRRVAAGAIASAVVAALLSAAVTSLTTTYLVQRSDDRRLLDAAGVLAVELDETDDPPVADLVGDEHRETTHTGIRFAVFREQGSYVAGDTAIESVEGCRQSGDIRSCGVTSRHGFRVVAAGLHTPLTMFLALSSAVAAAVAALGAWIVAGPVASLLLGPLSRLREQLGSLKLASDEPAELGPPDGLIEVDALRETIQRLLGRISDTVRHAERFAADAAHELRTPLTTIRGELELLAELRGLPADVVLDLQRATRKVVELQTLVERLLVLALPDQGEWSARELLSLQDLAEDLILQLPASDRARVELRAARGDVEVRGDAALLATLLSNALSNALKFASFARMSVAEDGGEVVLRIADDGPGVPVELRHAVFEPFVRATLSQTGTVPGHGLGLALIAHIARRHGGSARFIDGAPGAQLEIRLPRLAAPYPNTVSAPPVRLS